ncbi:MAG: rhomboid family intramembrane serine protease [Bacteroidota bacterium]|nr:rhomboid family intramembrane serine protease [Bacteroidota bacterium]
MYKDIKPALVIILLIWLVFLISIIVPSIELRSMGIRPRTIDGLWGILFTPFLHGSWSHIISNTIPLLILLPILFTVYKSVKYRTLLISLLLGGLLVWLLAGSNSNHIGASGIVFALIGFVITAGIIKLNFLSILIAAGVVVLYGGATLKGFVPEEGISWQGHLFGAMSGVFSAWVLRKSIRKKKEIQQ